MIAGCTWHRAATRVLTGSLPLLAAIAILSGIVASPALQCSDGMSRRLTTHAAVSATHHAAAVGTVGRAAEAAGQLAGAGDSRSGTGPCMSTYSAAPATTVGVAAAGTTDVRRSMDRPSRFAADPPPTLDLAQPLSPPAVLRT